jgi:cytidylyltransferase
MDKKSYVVIQARMGSSRRPGKISYLFDNETMLAYQIKRLKSYNIENIIVATSDSVIDDLTEDIALNEGVECFRGPEHDLIRRYYECGLNYGLETIIRVGADDPLIDPKGIVFLYDTYKKYSEYDLIYTSHKDGWIYGTAAELFTFDAIKQANKFAKESIEREHIIPYFKHAESIRKMMLDAPSEIRRSDIYLSVDYQEDLDLIEQILKYFTSLNKRYNFNQKELVELYDSGRISIKNRHLHSGF